jgi:hypothetical protein
MILMQSWKDDMMSTKRIPWDTSSGMQRHLHITLVGDIGGKE